MKKIGIICEYNPFHNGHLYHIQKIREKYPDCIIICVLSGNYVERGEVSLLNKWDKTTLALEFGIDLVVELPYPFATQSADLFCKGATQILDALKVDTLIFGSESNDCEFLKKLAKIQLEEKYQEKVKFLMKEGNNYPTAMAKAFQTFGISEPFGPNDTLGIGYIRELMKKNSKIEIETIQRTNDYHSKEKQGKIMSAEGIRTALKEGKNVDSYLPYPISNYTLHHMEDYFPLLKYKIISETNLNRYQLVEEGIESRIQKQMISSNSYEELLQKIKTKRYTYHKLSRTLLSIFTGFTKEEANSMKEISYIRILGFNQKGKQYLKEMKKECIYPILSKFEKKPMLELEERVSFLYDNSLEHKKKPIEKK